MVSSLSVACVTGLTTQKGEHARFGLTTFDGPVAGEPDHWRRCWSWGRGSPLTPLIVLASKIEGELKGMQSRENESLVN